MTPEDVASFWHNGFAGPFALETPLDQIIELRNRYEEVVVARHKQPLYGRHSLRDWHLIDDGLERLLTQDSIVSRVACLLGPDLLLWRSDILPRPPGGGLAARHQNWERIDGGRSKRLPRTVLPRPLAAQPSARNHAWSPSMDSE
jgi:non-heme Fe2+,alpha-ketoglutarate-dependent halogenase